MYYHRAKKLLVVSPALRRGPPLRIPEFLSGFLHGSRPFRWRPNPVDCPVSGQVSGPRRQPNHHRRVRSVEMGAGDGLCGRAHVTGDETCFRPGREDHDRCGSQSVCVLTCCTCRIARTTVSDDYPCGARTIIIKYLCRRIRYRFPAPDRPCSNIELPDHRQVKALSAGVHTRSHTCKQSHGGSTESERYGPPHDGR